VLALTCAPSWTNIVAPTLRTEGTSWGRGKLTRALGPGLITGASDDDPSGIATYSQAGAQFGFQLAWTLLLTYPMMVVVQAVSARIGRRSPAHAGVSRTGRRAIPRYSRGVRFAR
jgi:Mn2+/Fe2+ NRAMP family transporter